MRLVRCISQVLVWTLIAFGVKEAVLGLYGWYWKRRRRWNHGYPPDEGGSEENVGYK